MSHVITFDSQMVSEVLSHNTVFGGAWINAFKIPPALYLKKPKPQDETEDCIDSGLLFTTMLLNQGFLVV